MTTNLMRFKTVAEAVQKLAEAEHEELIRCDGFFACNNGPGLRQASDSIVHFNKVQKVWLPFQPFGMKSHDLPLRIHGILPLDFQDDENGKYLIIVSVVADEHFSQAEGRTIDFGDHEVVFKEGDFFVGIARFRDRFFQFLRVQRVAPAA